MKQYDMKCPVCGHMNHKLYLEETEGWMECEKCLHISRCTGDGSRMSLPLIDTKKAFLNIAAR